MPEPLNIAILGLGTGASGVVKILNEQAAAVNRRAGFELNIRRIAVRDAAKPRRHRCDGP